MIIFDLDGTLADCEHRRHFIDPEKAGDSIRKITNGEGKVSYKRYTGEPWKPDWKSFYKACDQDKPIYPTIEIFHRLNPYVQEIAIWSGRCESVRDKTEKWLIDRVFMGNFITLEQITLKMRPMGDYTPDDILKERWLDERIDDMGNQAVHDIDFVFDDRPKVVRMWRRRGIFVFNCCQHDEEF